jgi:hypothetical protein
MKRRCQVILGSAFLICSARWRARLISRPSFLSMDHPSPHSSRPQGLVRVGTPADAALIDAWLMARAPLAVPEARARRLSLEALLAQGGQGLCLIDGAIADAGNPGGEASPNTVHGLLPVTLIHSLSTGGRVALAAEWWGPADLDDPAASTASLAACCDVLADWCRAHGIRQVWLAPGLLADPAAAPRGFAPGADGLLHRSLVPTPKQLG